MNTGTTFHRKCPKCGNNTVDVEGDCHYAYCDEAYYDNDEENERNFMSGEAEHRELTEDEKIIYSL